MMAYFVMQKQPDGHKTNLKGPHTWHEPSARTWHTASSCSRSRCLRSNVSRSGSSYLAGEGGVVHGEKRKEQMVTHLVNVTRGRGKPDMMPFTKTGDAGDLFHIHYTGRAHS